MQKFSNLSLFLFFLFSIPCGYSGEELWLHLNPDYSFSKFDFRPELHLRKDLETGMETRAIKGNFILNQLISGAAYFHFPKWSYERRLYLGHIYYSKKWIFRELLEGRSFSREKTNWRLRFKLDFKWKENIGTTSEILYQTGQKDVLELRIGISFAKKIESNRIILSPTIIFTQYTGVRHILMLGKYF